MKTYLGMIPPNYSPVCELNIFGINGFFSLNTILIILLFILILLFINNFILIMRKSQ